MSFFIMELLRITLDILAISQFHQNMSIINGDYVPVGKYPFSGVVKISTPQHTSYCSFSLYYFRFGLTARHCFESVDNPSQVNFFAGSECLEGPNCEPDMEEIKWDLIATDLNTDRLSDYALIQF